jgi:hypothetical protein
LWLGQGERKNAGILLLQRMSLPQVPLLFIKHNTMIMNFDLLKEGNLELVNKCIYKAVYIDLVIAMWNYNTENI